jgi:hypothetical protein
MSVTTDKDSYLVGDTLTLNVTYADLNANASTLNITVTGTDAEGNTVTANASVQVAQNETGSMDISATDSWGDSYTVVSNDGVGSAVLTTTLTAPTAQQLPA